MSLALIQAPQRIVLAHGVFDALHLGHMRFLEAASHLGDFLVASVTSDRFASKAPGRPIHNQADRMAALSALACVDRVVLSDYPTAAQVIEEIRPQVYAKGMEYRDILDFGERTAAGQVDCDIRFIDTPVLSSSAFINRHAVSDEVAAYLAACRAKGFAERIPALIKRAEDLDVLFVGEHIVDEYVYVSPLGRPSKEFIVAAEEGGKEIFQGGVTAAARHAESFCGAVRINSTHAITKRRFVDRDTNRKLFEVYAHPWAEIGGWPHKIEEHDVTVVTDFGHGMIGDGDVEHLCSNARFLAVNAQTNAGNQGFNPVTRYHRADYVTIDLPEARLALRHQTISAEDAARVLTNRMSYGRVAITNGRYGCVMLDKRGHAKPDPITAPAFTTKAVDTIGAGDAFLAITAPLAKIASADDFELLPFIGNVAGALKVNIVGHREPVTKDAVLKSVATLLK